MNSLTYFLKFLPKRQSKDDHLSYLSLCIVEGVKHRLIGEGTQLLVYPWPIYLHISDTWNGTSNDADALCAEDVLQVERLPGPGKAGGHSGGHWDKAWQKGWQNEFGKLLKLLL